MSRPAWYRNKQYKSPMEPTLLSDGSIVEVQAITDNILVVIRQWPEGHSPHTDRIRITKDSSGSYNYQVAEHYQNGLAKEFIGDPDWHPPYVYSNAIPGTSPSSIEKVDFRTGTTHENRRDLVDYYEQKGYQLMSVQEQINAHDKYRPKPTDVSRERFFGNRPGVPEGAAESAYRENLNMVGDWDNG